MEAHDPQIDSTTQARLERVTLPRHTASLRSAVMGT